MKSNLLQRVTQILIIKNVTKIKNNFYKDLHSGVFGGSIHESMVDLVSLLNELVDNKGKNQLFYFIFLKLKSKIKKGKILIPGIYDSVKP